MLDVEEAMDEVHWCLPLVLEDTDGNAFPSKFCVPSKQRCLVAHKVAEDHPGILRILSLGGCFEE